MRLFGKKSKEPANKQYQDWNIPLDLLDEVVDDGRNTRSVSLRKALQSKEYMQKEGSLVFPIGLARPDVFLIADMHALPHILVGGQTGSGRSSFTEGALITSLIYRYSPEYLQLVLIDTKQVQLTQYSGIPHLARPIITTPENAKQAVEWLLTEMESRYQSLAESGTRNIVEYNQSDKGHMPFIVLISDEIADFMAVDRKYYEASFIKLLQKSRAVGIHLYIGSSRQDGAVISGLLRANIPCVAAFRTENRLDSRRLLGLNDAEELEDKGEMLFQSITHGIPKPLRLQAPFISIEEQVRLVDYIKHLS